MKKIALLTGGTSLERNVALKSVQLFEKYIREKYETFVLPEQLDEFISRKDEFTKVIPVFHGEYWEDGRIQALLDLLNVSYIWSSYTTNALCINKKYTNAIASQNGLNVPKELSIHFWDTLTQDTFSLSFPVILKPNTWGSSYHTYKIESFSELQEKVDIIWKSIKDDLLIQEYIVWDECSVSIVNGEVLDAIMFIEKDNPEDFFDYESKYESESSMRETFPTVESSFHTKLINITHKVIKIFDLKWYARVDYIVQDSVPYFLEVNTIPWTTEASILPKAWKLSKRSFEDLVDELLK